MMSDKEHSESDFCYLMTFNFRRTANSQHYIMNVWVPDRTKETAKQLFISAIVDYLLTSNFQSSRENLKSTPCCSDLTFAQ